jgi:N-acetylneuraminate synthase
MKGDRYYKKVEEQGYYIIAEAGVNYYEFAERYSITPLEGAKMMVKAAAENGADAIKFQTYKAKFLAMKDSPGAWDRNDIPVETQYELFQMYDRLGEKEYKELSEYAEKLGIEFISTPFDLESADYLEPYMEEYKISSSDISNIPLMTKIAQKNLPIILSTGASTVEEIDEAVALIRKYNDRQLTLLHCVLEYPTPYENANLRKIQSLAKRYPDVIVGYSDHTKPDAMMDVLKTAYLLGAKVIEKHFTLDKTIKKRNDHFHSMDCNDLKKLKTSLEFIKTICGSDVLGCQEDEITTRNSVRRSAVSARPIMKGEKLTEDMVIFKRPGTGIAPKDFVAMVGKTAVNDVEEDTLLKPDDFE